MDISTSTVVGQVLQDAQVANAITQFVTALITVVLIPSVTYLGLYIKSKYNSEQSTWKQKIAYRLVCFAEQKLEQAGAQGKFDYVAKQLRDHFKIKPEETGHLIEEAIIKLKTSQGGFK